MRSVIIGGAHRDGRQPVAAAAPNTDRAGVLRFVSRVMTEAIDPASTTQIQTLRSFDYGLLQCANE